MIPKKTTKMIAKDGNGNLVQLLPEIETASTIDASSDVPVSNAALASALEDIENSLPASALLDVMEEEPTALNTTELDDEALIVWMKSLPSWSITINTEAKTAGSKMGQIPFCLHNVEGASMTVNWGDGNIENYSPSNATENHCNVHEYAEAGIYTITITSASFEDLYIWSNIYDEYYRLAIYRDTLIAVNTPLPKLAGVYGPIGSGDYDGWQDDTLTWCFGNCSNLSNIPENIFINNQHITDFSHCFQSCNLSTIPAGLFNNNINATDFSSCFYGNTIQTIPDGLFNNNVNATDFNSCFIYCYSLQSIPVNLFKNNIAIADIGYCFCECSSLGSFTVHIGSSLVSDCYNFVDKKTGTTRTVYVPSGSTTQTTFNAQASSLGLTIIGE